MGTAGDGGLRTRDELVIQFNTSVGLSLTPSVSLMETVGYMNSATGDFKANVLGLSLSYKFTDLFNN